MYALTHSEESITSNQLASAIWFLLKHVPQRRREKKVTVRDAHTQSEEIPSPKNNFLPFKDSNNPPLDWYTTNYKWHVNTMTFENNLKSNELKNGHGQVVTNEMSQLPRDPAEETGSRSSKHLLLCVNCCKKKKKKLLRSVSEGKRKLFSKQKRRKEKGIEGGKGPKQEGAKEKEHEKEELREKEQEEEEVARKKPEIREAREKEQDIGEVRNHAHKKGEESKKEQEKGEEREKEQDKAEVREKVHRKGEARKYDQERRQAREKVQDKRSKKERKRKHRKRDGIEETESISDKDSNAVPSVSQPHAGKSTADVKRTKKKRRRKLLEKHDESDEFLSEQDKSKRLKRKEREHSPLEDDTIRVEKAHVSYAEDAPKDSTTAKQLPDFTKDFTTDFTKTCCYLCAQNTLAIKAAMSGKQGIEKDIQVSIEDVDNKKLPTFEKSSSPAPKVRTVQSSIRVKTRETSTSCPESSAAHKIRKVKSKRKKFRFAKILSKLKRRKKSTGRTVACDTDEIFVKCDNSAKCKWNNECRKGNLT